MPDMSHKHIVVALEEVRAGKQDVERVSDLENYLLDLLLNDGADAVGALLLNLEGMKFSLADAPKESPNLVFRSDHEDNALIIEVFASKDLASVSICPEKGEVPELPGGHKWFYGEWERLIGDEIADPLVLAEPDRTVYLIASFEADVMNGGIGQYLSNTSGRFVTETLDALKRVGANQTAEHLRKAAGLKRADENWDDLWERAGDQLGALDDRLMKDDEYLAMMTANLFGKNRED
jgi:hypothetical protein